VSVPPSPGPRGSARRTALQITGLYAGFAALWIVVSSLVAATLVAADRQLVWLEIAKGLLFVAVTAGLLAVVSAHLIGALARAHEEAERAQTALQERARLEGALLAARTALHHLSNELALTVGYAELLAADPRLPSDLREAAAEAFRGAAEAATTLQKLQHVVRLEEVDYGAPSGRVIDLDRSIETRD
jgi:hypothetical protein